MALLGGVVLTCLIAVTCLSVIGRVLNTLGHSDFVKDKLTFAHDVLTWFGPITGDFEIVEAGVAFAIMAFLPLCQLNRSHAIVEVFTGFMPGKANRFLDLLWETLFSFILIVIAWRLFIGTTDKMRYGETTFMLQFPVWWGYAACTVAAGIACLVAVHSVWLRIGDLRAADFSAQDNAKGAGT